MFRSLLRKESVATEEPKSTACVDCSTQFELVAGEVEFFIQRGLSLPKRCKPCRTARSHSPFSPKATKGAQKIKHSPHDIVCENCDKSATVPFPPAPGKAVYCKICWEGIKNLPLSAQR